MKTLRETILKHSWQEDMVGPHLVRVDDALSALRQWMEDEGLVVVPREPTVGMFRALTLSQVGDDDQNYRLGCWALGSFAADYAAMISAAPDALKAFDGVPPSPGAITGIRKAETPCSDCIDGWCQLNCGPRVG